MTKSGILEVTLFFSLINGWYIDKRILRPISQTPVRLTYEQLIEGKKDLDYDQNDDVPFHPEAALGLNQIQ